jgi:arylsulfatase A-like enzyme
LFLLDRAGVRRRSFLFITLDQWRGDCLGVLGHPVLRTPNLDRLARDGVVFAHHFAQCAPCGPSRASLYTGMYAMNHRAILNGTPLAARHTNVALEARRAGHDPVLFGYTDTTVDPATVSADDPRLATYEGVLPGFRAVLDLPEGNPRPWLEWLRELGYPVDPDGDWRAFVNQPVADAPGASDEEWGAHRAPTRYRAEHGQTAFLTDRFLAWAGDEVAAGRPWFAHLSYLRPHPPFFAPEPYNTMYDPATIPAPVGAATVDAEAAIHPILGVMVHHPLVAAPSEPRHVQQLRATYHGMQSEVDAQLGRIFDWLDETGLAAETVVVVTSDHGEQLADHHITGKLGFFDQSYHVPLIVRIPGTAHDATRGTIIDEPTEHVDVLPMLCELLDVDVPLQCDGRSLMPFLTGAAPDHWRDAVHWEFDFREPASRAFERAFDVTMEELSLTVLRDRHGKYVHCTGYPALPPLFFDLDADPDELVNRAADPECAPRVLDYAQRLLAWRGRHLDRSLAHMKLTPSGPFAHVAPRR